MTQTVNINSTIPGAIGCLLGYMNQVSADYSNTGNFGQIEVFLGPGIAQNTPQQYWLAIGEWPEGALWSGYQSTWAALPGAAKLVREEYSLECNLRAWQGSTDPTTTVDQMNRVTEAFILYNDLFQYLVNDPGGSDKLTPSGSWEMSTLEMPTAGPMGGAGWGVVGTFSIFVRNVQLTG